MVEPLSRICIFVFFDPQGIVDSYVLQLLDHLRPNLSRLMVVSNCEVSPKEAQKLRSHCDELRFRENRGMDAAAFRDGMIRFCGWEQLMKYDEVVLVNDTFFGPIHSFADMFEQMSHRDLDFWGMSAGYQQNDGWGLSRYGYIPDHIQTFFVAFRKNMVASPEFQDYWNHYDESMTSFKEVVSGHEIIMTRHFADLGFRWDVYAQSEKYRSGFRDEDFNIYFYRSCEMMRDFQFPVFKKKVLCADMAELLYMNDLEDAGEAMDYIRRHSDYPSELIWENVLRLYPIEDLYHSLHLNYVLPSEPAEVEARAAMVFHLTGPRFAGKFLERAKELTLPVYLIAEDEATAQLVREAAAGNPSVHLLEGSGQQTEMGAFVLCCRDLAKQYDFLGFVHDVQNPDHLPATVGESLISGFLQNTANDSCYVSRILRCFQENPRLGILGTPFPIHHTGFRNLDDRWNGYFRAVQQTAEQWKLRCKLSEDRQPIMNNGTFWCRTASLAPIWSRSWQPDQFRCSPISLESRRNEVLKRILPYVAQSCGYYSGIVMHTDYASMRLTGQELILENLLGMTRKQLGITSETYLGYRDQLKIFGTGTADGNVTVNLSELGVGFLLKYILVRYLPRKVMGQLRKLAAFLMRLHPRKSK